MSGQDDFFRDLIWAVTPFLNRMRRECGIPTHWRTSFIARDPDNPEAEFLVTNDSVEELLGCVERCAARTEIEAEP